MTHCSHYFGMHIIFLRDQNFIMIYLCDFSHPNEGKGEERVKVHLVSVWIPLKLRFRSFFLFLFFLFSCISGVMLLLFMHCSLNSSCKCWLFFGEQCIHALFTDPQISFFSNFFIKNGSHGTIHTFKNYFATVFSVSVK